MEGSCSLHIGLSTGELHLYYVGGVRDRWDWVIGGEPIGRASCCEHLATGGQVSPTNYVIVTTATEIG